MKKAMTVFLVAVTILAIVLTAAFFVRRNIPEGGIMIFQNVRTDAETPSSSPAQTVPASSNSALVNINTATVDELTTLPGIGPVLAQRIVDYREEHGNFTSLTDLMKINGIGSTKMESILDLITLGG